MSADSQGSEAPLSTLSIPTPPSPPSSPLPDITTTSSPLSDAPSSAGPVAAFTADPGSAESVSVLHLLFDVALVFGPVIGYLMQWRTMWREKSCDGYSAGVSLILLLCNSVRLGYRVGETFADALMYQSVVMIAVQLGILLTVSSLKRTHALITSVESGHASNVGIPPRPDVGNPSSSSLRALGQVALQQLWHAVRHPSDSIEELLLMPFFAVVRQVRVCTGWYPVVGVPGVAGRIRRADCDGLPRSGHRGHSRHSPNLVELPTWLDGGAQPVPGRHMVRRGSGQDDLFSGGASACSLRVLWSLPALLRWNCGPAVVEVSAPWKAKLRCLDP